VSDLIVLADKPKHAQCDDPRSFARVLDFTSCDAVVFSRDPLQSSILKIVSVSAAFNDISQGVFDRIALDKFKAKKVDSTRSLGSFHQMRGGGELALSLFDGTNKQPCDFSVVATDQASKQTNKPTKPVVIELRESRVCGKTKAPCRYIDSFVANEVGFGLSTEFHWLRSTDPIRSSIRGIEASKLARTKPRRDPSPWEDCRLLLSIHSI